MISCAAAAAAQPAAMTATMCASFIGVSPVNAASWMPRRRLNASTVPRGGVDDPIRA